MGEVEQRLDGSRARRLEPARLRPGRRRIALAGRGRPVAASPLADAFARRIEGPYEHGPVLTGEAGVEDERAVVVPVVVDVFELVLAARLRGTHPLVDAECAIELRRGEHAREREQPLLAGRRGDAGKRAYLRVGELAPSERVPDVRQLSERAGKAHELCRLPVGDAKPPCDPALEPITADVRAVVVLGQQPQPPRHGRIDVRLLLREFGFEPDGYVRLPVRRAT